MAKAKLTIKLRSPVVEHTILAGGDGGFTMRSPVDPEVISRALHRLAEHYRVEPGDWGTLAYVLALKGGFIQIEAAEGKIAHWNDCTRAALVLAADAWKSEHSTSLDKTFKSAAFRQHWGELSGQMEQASTLSTRYHETRRRIRDREVSGPLDLVWLVEQLATSDQATFKRAVDGSISALLSQARLDRAHEKMMRQISTDLTG